MKNSIETAVVPITRTTRTILTFLSSLLQQGAQILVTMLITPIIVGGLGVQLYGAWTIIQQTVGYLALGDLRPGSALKLKLAITQNVADYEQKNNQISAAIIVWIVMQPVLWGIGSIIVIQAPIFIKVDAWNVGTLQKAMLFAVVNVCIAGLLSLPQNILRGMNLDYKGMGINALTTVFVGVLNVLAIKLNTGLPGISFSVLIGAILGAFLRYLILRKNIKWLKVSRPQKKEVWQLLRLSGWVLISSLSFLLLNSTDYILIGVLLNAEIAGILSVTSIILRGVSMPVNYLLSAAGPSLADLWGRKENQRIATLRITIQTLAIALMTVLGLGLVIYNRSFIKLWIGPEYYAGDTVNFFLIILTIQSIFLYVDATFMDFMLEVKRKSFVILVSGVVSIILGVALAGPLGLLGIILADLVGQILLTIYLTFFVTRRIATPTKEYFQRLLMPISFCITLLIVGYMISPIIGDVTNWFDLGWRIILTLSITAIFVWFVVVNKKERIEIYLLVQRTLHP